jgi:protoporphyrinogen oxidase
MLGLTVALRLAERGARPTVLEAAPAVGGLASADPIGDYTWDRFYHVILQSDLHLLGLLEELGLTDRLTFVDARTGFFTGGRLVPLNGVVDFLRFPPLSLFSKARLAATILYASRVRDGRRLEAVPVLEWLRRWSGTPTAERIWRPLLRAKLGDNADRVSAAFIWAIIARMYAARRSGLRQERFGYVEGGYATILPRFYQHATEHGVAFISGRPVAEVKPAGGGVDIRWADGEVRRFDAAVLTVPCGAVAKLCPALTPAERERLNRVVYQGVVCVSLLLTRPLAGYYITNITDDGLPFTAVIETTALVDRRAFGGRSLVYLPRYAAQDDPLWHRDDAAISEECIAGLRAMYPDLDPREIEHVKVARAREVQALATLNYSGEALPPVRTSVPAVYVVNSAQIVNGTLNNNEIVALGNAAAPGLAEALGA